MGIQIRMMKQFRFFNKFCIALLLMLAVGNQAFSHAQKSAKKSVVKKRSIKPKSSGKSTKGSASKKAKKTATAKKNSGNAAASKSVAGNKSANKNAINHLASHKFWSVHSYKEGGKKVCFIASKPQSSKGSYNKRDEVFFMITHRKSEGNVVKNELSFAAGYPLKKDMTVTLEIDGVDYKMPIVREGNAWTKDTESDQAVVAAMKKGGKLVVKGVSQKGTATTDTFSLSGVTAALSRAKKECGF